jgi:large conductance mechanosensitive channel
VADKSETPKKKVIVERATATVAVLPAIKAPHWLQGFVDFVREQGVIGLAVGLVLGTQIKTLVDQLVASFVNPFVGLLLPGGGSLPEKAFHISDQTFKWGAFVSQLISFLIVAAIIYFAVKGLKLDKLDKKKEA